MLDQSHDTLHRLAIPAIKAHGLSANTEVTLLNVSENATFRLTDGDRDLILRVHRSGYHTHQEIASELAWAAAVRDDTGIDTPRVVPTLAGDDVLVTRASPLPDERYCVAFEPLPGTEPSSDELVAWAPRLGAITAGLHEHASRWDPPSWFMRPAWTVDTILGAMPRWGSWEDHADLDADGRDLLNATASQLTQRIAAYAQARGSAFGIVHADMRLSNLLADGDRLSVIDFDDCGPGFFLWDLATAFTFIEDDSRVLSAAERWVDGYRTTRELDVEDLAEVPTFVMLRRLQVLAWIVSHADTDVGRAEGGPYTEATLKLADLYLAGQLLPLDR